MTETPLAKAHPALILVMEQKEKLMTETPLAKAHPALILVMEQGFLVLVFRFFDHRVFDHWV